MLGCTLSLAVATAGRAAELHVVAITPAPNAMASATTTVRVDFDRALDPATISADTVRVFGRGSGTASGPLVLSNGDQSLTLPPAHAFSAGEAVLVNLSHAIAAADGALLRSAGFAAQFTVATKPSARVFQLIDSISNRTGGAHGPVTRIYGAQAADLNHDGFLDLATVNEVSADVRVALNRADGSGLFQGFLAPSAIGDESSPNEPADFDNDGDTDGCFSAADGQSVTVLLGHGDGTYGAAQTIALGGEPHGIAVLDVDGDADLDIVDANRSADDLALMLNDGHGVFGTPTRFDAGVTGEYGLAAGDMNGDGITDLVVAGRDGLQIVTLLGHGDGTFAAAGAPRGSGGNTWVVTLGDVDGDGILDATTANSTSNNGAVLIGNGDGTFKNPVLMATGAHTPSTDLGDLDGDGDLDWVLSSFGGGFWRVYTNDGSGHFTFDQQVNAPSNPSCAVLLDLDNDGDLDMALTDEVADVILLEQNGGAVPTPVCAPTPLPCRTPLASGKAAISLKDSPLDKRDALRWTWSKGAATTKADFGDPTTTDDYDLCLYDAGTLVAAAAAPAGGLCPTRPCWRSRKHGFDYGDRLRTPNGVQSLTLREGAAGKARMSLAAKGINLNLPPPETLTGPLDVQLQRSSAGPCWSAHFSTPFKRHDAGKLSDKSD